MMENWVWVYVMAVVPCVAVAARLIGSVALVAALIGFIVEIANDPEDSYGRHAHLGGAKVRRLWPWGAALLTLGMLVPTTESLIRAYVLVEGSQLVTAENAEAAGKALLERVDALIEAMGRSK